MVLGSFGLFYASVVNFWRRPGLGLALIAGALVLFGVAWGILHAIGQEGF
jgi:hypothetical protein